MKTDGSMNAVSITIFGALLLCFLQVTIIIFSTTSSLVAPPTTRDLGFQQDDAGKRFLMTTTATQATKFSTKACRCPKMELEELKQREAFYSQKHEDEKLLMGFFNGLCGGTYVEMGALTGKDFSNTHVFNDFLGWNGLMIEPSPNNYQKLQANRPHDKTVNAAVCGKERLVHFYEKPGLGAVNGIWEFASPSFREGAWGGATLADTTPIECKPLSQIIDQQFGVDADQQHYFDIFSLDVEGAEIEVLRSLDLTRVGFGVVLVENQTFDMVRHWSVRTLLEQHGYWFLEREGGNDWFVNKAFYEIYNNISTEH